ncbi:MAG: hypothetical protein AABY22_06175 [Nanoarchaeota archaeon]
MKPKIWICISAAARGQEENLTYLATKCFSYFDGAIITLNFNAVENPLVNPTYFILDKFKKNGRILINSWVGLHYISMTMFLQTNLIKNGDWVLVLDSQELVKKEWLEQLRVRTEKYEKEGVTSMFWGRPYYFKYNNQMTYVGQPHCWPYPLTPGKIDNIQDEQNVKYDDSGVHFSNFIYNKKKFEDTMLLHSVKYYLYNISNQPQMFYKDDELLKHESARQAFCQLLDDKGYERTLEGLEKFFRNKDNLTDDLLLYVNSEWVFLDFYRYKILGHELKEILNTRHTFKLNSF